MQDLSRFVKRMESKGNFSPQNSSAKCSGREEESSDSRDGKSYVTKQANSSKVLERICEHIMSHW